MHKISEKVKARETTKFKSCCGNIVVFTDGWNVLRLQIGQALVDDGHYASKDITDTLNKLNYQWADLYERAKDKVTHDSFVVRSCW